MTPSLHTPRYRPFTLSSLERMRPFDKIPQDRIQGIRLASRVLPFRVSNYVVEELIDWDRIPEDPIFQLTFPQPEMLLPDALAALEQAQIHGSPEEMAGVVARIRMEMNPHPAGQMDLNVPVCDGMQMNGMQHKYPHTVLFFPAQGQTCHSYCTYCFRWAQFIGKEDLRFASSDPMALVRYLHRNPEVTDVLFTGGDPLMMRTRLLETYVTPLLRHRPEHLTSIRFGTKVPAYWPYRFTTDPDADALLALFAHIVNSGIHLSIMVHFSHDRELETDAVAAALRRIRETGAQIRCQAPLIRHINDNPGVWARMWQRQVALGAVPYYMFVERDTGPKGYFNLPLHEAFGIYTGACQAVSGLARTARGPSMSAGPGKVLVDGIATINGERVFVLKFLQARRADWVNRVFFAAYDKTAFWLDDLKPAFGESEFFFEKEYAVIKEAGSVKRKMACKKNPVPLMEGKGIFPLAEEWGDYAASADL